LIGRYRTAERILTVTPLATRIGKPGQASAPVGKKLNEAANACVEATLKTCRISPATHDIRIHDAAVVEAFPSSFLGVMIANPSDVAASRQDRSDLFFQHLERDGTLGRLLSYLLPNRRPLRPIRDIRNHDDRAAFVCALTALAVAAQDFTAVGDDDGWIVLPPRRLVAEWAWAELLIASRKEIHGCLFQVSARSPTAEALPSAGL